jgi:hypothetical protein
MRTLQTVKIDTIISATRLLSYHTYNRFLGFTLRMHTACIPTLRHRLLLIT